MATQNFEGYDWTYLGDGVYCRVRSEADIALITWNGMWAENEIILEPSMIRELAKLVGVG